MARETKVIDEAASDPAVPTARFDISSFGADFDVEGLVKRLNRNDIFIPPFQRNYVWNIKEASRFIESLLLGLPVPAVFLAKEPDTNRMLVIDGQQRLKTLQFFFNGFFRPVETDTKKHVFRLVDVQKPFANKTYEGLEEADRIRLNDSVIHSIIVRQEEPPDDDTSVFHIFERLNSGGRKLTPQEMRAAVCHGPLITLLRELNEHASWRKTFGKSHNRLKDEELILRFLALLDPAGPYERPMTEFLTKFALKNRRPTDKQRAQWTRAFRDTTDLMFEAVARKAFRPERALNAAVFDSVMVGLARHLKTEGSVSPNRVADAYRELLEDDDYQKATQYATSDEANVAFRLKRATEAFRHA
jgi:hypothetical protein